MSKSVAIVAMGVTNQEWFRRSYRGDSPEFFEKVILDRFVAAEQDVGFTEGERRLLKQIAKSASVRKTEREVGPPFDEIWAINHMGKMLKKCDMIVAMDDLRNEKERYDEMLVDDVPILTSKVYPEFNSIEYPIRDVVKELNQGDTSFMGTYIRNSVTAAVCYAIYKKFGRIALFGADFYYDQMGAKSEEARANCEFWLGYAHAKGIRIEVSKGSTTLDMNKPHKLYGYKDQPSLPFDEKHDFVPHGNTWRIEPLPSASGSDEKDEGEETSAVDAQAV